MTTQAETMLSLMSEGVDFEGPRMQTARECIQMVTEVERPPEDTTTKADSMHIVGFKDMSVMVLMYEGNKVVGVGCPPIGGRVHKESIKLLAVDAMTRLANRASAEFEA